jgi:hypothetical protein
VKWVDNLLSQHRLMDVLPDNRRASRRITDSALLRMAAIRTLHIELGMSVAQAVAFSTPLIESAELSAGHLRLMIDLTAIRQRLDERLAFALESAPQPRKGRPPRH